MERSKVERSKVNLQAEHVGGIERTSLSFEPGVTILTGRNATNRTSLLRAVMAALGSNRASIKGNADSASVTLQVGEETYTRQMERRADGVAYEGSPYLDDSELADLFAFLLESNEARRTVALGGDLREVIMRPVDSEAIEQEIRELTGQKERVEDRIQQLEQVKGKLPDLEQERADIEADIEAKKAELADKREALDDLSTNADEAQDERTALQKKTAELERVRSDRRDVEFQVESQEESLASLRSELEELQEEHGNLEDGVEMDVGRLKDKLASLRSERRGLEGEMSKLQDIIQFNEEMLDGTASDIASALRDEAEGEAVTDQLLTDADATVCWTCGSEVEQEHIERTIERLRELRQSKYGDKQRLDDEIDDLKSQVSAHESQQARKADLQRRIEQVTAELEERESRLDELATEREELTTRLEELETEIEGLEAEDRSDVLTLHREVNQLEIELDRLEQDRDNLTEQITDLESKVDELDNLARQKENIQTQLAEVRTRVEQLETEAIEAFNHHMETILDILNYENLERIWVDRVERDTRKGRQKVTKAEFRLHIVRNTDGVTYEDDFDHLSESEREVTGLVFALAGYLAHDVHEVVPFVLLDSLEAIDGDRIAKLVEYFSDYADYLVVALLQEDAGKLPEEYQRITEI